MSLFDKRIHPILLYGSAIWSIPSSHTHINMTLENIPEKNTKEHISNCLNPLGLEKVNLISIRVYKAKNIITIKLNNVITKSRILLTMKKTPVTYHMMDHETQNSSVATVHANYCKFTLGISKYESTTQTLGELGRFPLQNKATCLALSYWIRLEKGTDSLILNRAFNECTKGNLKWYNDIYYVLQSNGLQNVRENKLTYSPQYVKKLVLQRLNDQFCQKYNNYVTNNKTNKTEIINACNKDKTYDMIK